MIHGGDPSTSQHSGEDGQLLEFTGGNPHLGPLRRSNVKNRFVEKRKTSCRTLDHTVFETETRLHTADREGQDTWTRGPSGAHSFGKTKTISFLPTYPIIIQKSQSLNSVFFHLKENFGDGSQEQSVSCQQVLLFCLSLHYFCTPVKVVIIGYFQ